MIFSQSLVKIEHEVTDKNILLFHIGSYVKLSPAVAAIMVGGWCH